MYTNLYISLLVKYETMAVFLIFISFKLGNIDLFFAIISVVFVAKDAAEMDLKKKSKKVKK